MGFEDCWIKRIMVYIKAISEPPRQPAACRRIHPYIDPFFHRIGQHPEIIDPVRMVGMIVCEKNTVEYLHAGVDQLLAQIR